MNAVLTKTFIGNITEAIKHFDERFSSFAVVREIYLLALVLRETEYGGGAVRKRTKKGVISSRQRRC